MLKNANSSHQHNFFDASLWDYLDTSDPLFQLAHAINWFAIEEKLSVHYAHNNGRPALPIRLMAGLIWPSRV